MMKLIFVETPVFSRLRSEYLSEESFQALQIALLEHPEVGDVMPGTGGLRKLRWEDKQRGKGKRGGLRIVYFHLAGHRQIWFFTLYSKGEVDDLSASEKVALKAALVRALAVGKMRQ